MQETPSWVVVYSAAGIHPAAGGRRREQSLRLFGGQGPVGDLVPHGEFGGNAKDEVAGQGFGKVRAKVGWAIFDNI